MTRLGARDSHRVHERAFLATGVCGSLSTFSTLMVELVGMADRSRWALACGYGAASIAGGLIAVTLGIGLVFAWRAMTSRGAQAGALFPFMMAALAGIWAINFFVVLPVVSPAFVGLVPYSVSLVSKLLFGLAAASAFRLLASPVLALQPARMERRS